MHILPAVMATKIKQSSSLTIELSHLIAASLLVEVLIEQFRKSFKQIWLDDVISRAIIDCFLSFCLIIEGSDNKDWNLLCALIEMSQAGQSVHDRHHEIKKN